MGLFGRIVDYHSINNSLELLSWRVVIHLESNIKCEKRLDNTLTL